MKGLFTGAPGTPITVNFPESDVFAMQSNLHDVYGYLNTTNLVNKAFGRGVFFACFFGDDVRFSCGGIGVGDCVSDDS